MTNLRTAFLAGGYAPLSADVAALDLVALEREYALLAEIAQSAIAATGPRGGVAPGNSGLVVVPEAAQPSLLCRFEHLSGASTWIRDTLVPRLAELADDAIGEPMVLFKDKCNMKRPGGGAFPPHQDITAYRHFDTSYHVTAAIMLDAAVRANGALEVATRWDTKPPGVPLTPTPRGPLPVLPSYEGGARNGDIADEFSSDMDWMVIEGEPGSVLLFDSFVPHRSQKNGSLAARRMLFFTFSLAREGAQYERYYRAKRAAPHDPKFHVSTPTLHAAAS